MRRRKNALLVLADTFVQTSQCAYMTSADLDKLKKSKNKANTVRQTAWALNCFQTSVIHLKAFLRADLLLMSY